jgi:succinate-semialdehyde dehydrogenase/glutarate-semialdehyde dehydrogenase
MELESINPSTDKLISTYTTMTSKVLSDTIEATHDAFEHWRKTDLNERSNLLKRLAEGLEKGKESYARLMADEMGKPLTQGRSEIEKCTWVCNYYAVHGADYLADEYIDTEASSSWVSFRPMGVVLAIMPWNFPFWQVFRFAAPALMAGNAALLKHAPNVCGCASAIESLCKETGFPESLFTTLLIGTDLVGEVIEHPRVMAVTLTGSTQAGKAVAEQAGRMLKKTVLELGGSDPYVVLEDADVTQTVNTCVTSRLLNSGQSCIAAKRFIVVESVCEAFTEQMVEKMKQVRMGMPTDESVTLGPLARKDLRENLHRQVQDSIKQGAICCLGAQLPDGPGAFYPPTVLSGVQKGMPAYDEELFGPVAAITEVSNETEALKAANDSSYGLGAAVFTGDPERGRRIAVEELDAGCCFVNDFVKSDPRLPFGGIKQSGYGRELSYFGIREFVNIKTINVK